MSEFNPATSWFVCPYCESEDIMRSDYDYSGDEYAEEIDCFKCNESWWEVYKRSHREEKKQ